jgi:bacterioferritin (cytochrome b1)
MFFGDRSIMEPTADNQIIQMLNEMLEEERAAVEAVIGLTSMATDPHERERLQQIGGDEVWSCSGLRDRIEALGGTPSRHISDFASYVLSLDYYPERLRTYGRHQRLIMERISTLIAQRGLDTPTRDFLAALLTQHEADVSWCEQRANVFEASRYGGELPPRPQTPPAVPPRMNAPQSAPAGRVNGAQSPSRTPTPQRQQPVTPQQNRPAFRAPAPAAVIPPPTPVVVTPPPTPTPAPIVEPPPAAEETPTPAPEKPRTRRRRTTAASTEASDAPKSE